jgi:hypothetical protein
MIASGTAMAVTLGGISLAMAAEGGARQVSLHDLVTGDFQIVAEGQLIESVTCIDSNMPVYHSGAKEPCFGRVAYGSFKRLKNAEQEFVCVSFRGWTCY